MLDPVFDFSGDELTPDHDIMSGIALGQARVGLPEDLGVVRDFASNLADITREKGFSTVSTDYDPDETLLRAAKAARMPVNSQHTFPWKSTTAFGGPEEDPEKVFAQKGPNGEWTQIWPPEPPETA